MGQLSIELIAPFVTGTKETFETMVGMRIRRRDVYLKKGYGMFGQVSGIIGLSGHTVGTCAVSMPQALAIEVIGRLIGGVPESGIENTELCDGVGEIINMIAGSAKSILSSTPHHFDITLPTIICGPNHEFFQRKGADCVSFLFETDTRAFFTLDVCVAAR
jgi:chemotaxis protein CheX